MTKEERREQIAERVKRGFKTYWLTRDRLNGELSSQVDVWTARPDRFRLEDGDVQWLASDHYARWTLEVAYREVRAAVPATDRECVCVGDAPAVAS